jgi:hypothetical protein
MKTFAIGDIHGRFDCLWRAVGTGKRSSQRLG